MEQQQAIVAEHITKCYQLYQNQKQRLKGFLTGKAGKTFYALNDISFTVNRGESVGLVGMNGSGKSTLSNIIAGIAHPTKGVITTNGTPSLIAVSSGLNNYLTGLENIVLKGLMMGLTMQQIDELKPAIEEFADVGEFIRQPVKSFSSGMKSRLGFAISVNMNPDIMVIDEALSVGDSAFSQKCLAKMDEFRKQGKTIVFVSHSAHQVQSFCDKVLWLEYGTLRAYGSCTDILPAYSAFVKEFAKWDREQQLAYRKKILETTKHISR